MNKIAFALVSSLSLTGCLDTMDADIDTQDTDVENVGRIATNGLSAALAFSTLASYPLSNSILSSSSISNLLATADGRLVLDYVIGCALSSGNSFSSGGYTFQGSVGAYNLWETTPMSTTAGKVVAGCFWGRVNAHNKVINVSLRGAGLGTVSGETTTYQITEGAFWGNIFANFGSVSGSACMGVDQANPANEALVTPLADRDCTEDAGGGLTQCGFTYTGSCSAVCSGPGDGTFTSCSGATQIVSAFLEGNL